MSSVQLLWTCTLWVRERRNGLLWLSIRTLLRKNGRNSFITDKQRHSAFKGGLSGVERIGLTFPQSPFPVLAGDYFHEEEVSIYVIKYYNPITTMILFHWSSNLSYYTNYKISKANPNISSINKCPFPAKVWLLSFLPAVLFSLHLNSQLF